MMFETLIFLAAAAGSAPSAPEATACEQAAPAVNPALLEMTYNAFVAVEETPAGHELVRPAVAAERVKQAAIAGPVGTAWIS